MVSWAFYIDYIFYVTFFMIPLRTDIVRVGPWQHTRKYRVKKNEEVGRNI